MYFNRMTLLGLVVLSCIAGGCAKKGPKYTAPKLPDSEVAVVKGSWGTTIEKIDGANVDSPFRIGPAFMSSHSVRVDPGERLMIVYVDWSDQQAQPWQSGLSLNVKAGKAVRQTYYFSFRFDKGHVYEFSPASMTDNRLKVADKTTNQTLYIE